MSNKVAISPDPEIGVTPTKVKVDKVNNADKVSKRQKMASTMTHAQRRNLVNREKSKRFDNIYAKLGSKAVPEVKKTDMVLVRRHVETGEIEEDEERAEQQKKDMIRNRFEAAMKEEGLHVESQIIDDNVYTEIYAPFKRLCEEAEHVSFQRPLLGCETEYRETMNKFDDWVEEKFVTDTEIDLVSAPFKMDMMQIYENYENPNRFFRPAIRSLLVGHILKNIDLRQGGNTDGYKRARHKENSITNCWGCLKIEEDDELGELQSVGIDYMMVEGVYTQMFTLHTPSEYKPDDKEHNKTLPENPSPEQRKNDPRYDLQLTWTKFFKFQPLWKIRYYFGEKIGLYFAWAGTLISSLWIPMLFGFVIFIYGIAIAVEEAADGTTSSATNSSMAELFTSLGKAFDNGVTPYYALFLCIWGTIFIEIWKRKQAKLAYEWDVDDFESHEPDRPQFYGFYFSSYSMAYWSMPRYAPDFIFKDPVTKEEIWFYPFTRQVWKITFSVITLLFMMFVVLAALLAVIVYRVFIQVDYCPYVSDGECLMASTIISSVLNAICIIVLGKFYNWLAYKLTDWENHRTETVYNDNLVLKLFGFQFVNTYSSCFYIAFFRERFDDNGVLGLGSKYKDSCSGTCMSQLSFQVLILMISTPISKFCVNVLVPIIVTLIKKKCTCMAKVPCLKNFFNTPGKPESEKTFLEKEAEKPSLGNFTLEEYTEKVIQYGLMMLFAASNPLAPFLALLSNLVDMRMDAFRMLWIFQRPSAIIAEDIGTWQVILTFLNFIGVICNAFLIAFTSDWGSHYSSLEKLWIVIGFEHIVFLAKFLISYLIPDVPRAVRLAKRKKVYHLNRILEEEFLRDAK